MIELEVNGLDDLERVALAVAAMLEPRDVIELHGDVGAGKTTFTRLLARALGIVEPVRSPTYTIAQVYSHPDGERCLAHLDCYRDGSAAMGVEAYADLEPVLDGATWTSIEWPTPIEPWIAGRTRWRFDLVAVDETARTMVVHPPTPARAVAFNALLATGPHPS